MGIRPLLLFARLLTGGKIAFCPPKKHFRGQSVLFARFVHHKGFSVDSPFCLHVLSTKKVFPWTVRSAFTFCPPKRFFRGQSVLLARFVHHKGFSWTVRSAFTFCPPKRFFRGQPVLLACFVHGKGFSVDEAPHNKGIIWLARPDQWPARRERSHIPRLVSCSVRPSLRRMSLLMM